MIHAAIHCAASFHTSAVDLNNVLKKKTNIKEQRQHCKWLLESRVSGSTDWKT